MSVKSLILCLSIFAGFAPAVLAKSSAEQRPEVEESLLARGEVFPEFAETSYYMGRTLEDLQTQADRRCESGSAKRISAIEQTVLGPYQFGRRRCATFENGQKICERANDTYFYRARANFRCN